MKTAIGLGVVLTALSVQAADTVPMQSVLFAANAKVPAVMQAEIVAHLSNKGWQVQGKQLATAQCGPVSHKLDVLDLNGDGVQEVMLLLGNECTSGKIGQTIYLFSQESEGKVQRQLGFSATGYQLVGVKKGEWPGLQFTGTGDCQPIWSRQNGRYNFHQLYEAKAGACAAPASGKKHGA